MSVSPIRLYVNPTICTHADWPDNCICGGHSGNQFQPVDSFDFASRWLKFPVLEKPVCAVNQL
ncbi:MAG: hypothetical protein AB7S77_23465, partial [Desulfatirhabdiaceae bacterium]